METTTLERELERYSAPEVIEFLSLDIEGAEYLAMKNFPFNRYKFMCACIERPTPELDFLLGKNGYVQLSHISYDVIYGHRDFIKQVNMRLKFLFAITPKKKW